MKKYEVTLDIQYEVEAADEDAAYYMAVQALKKDLPENCAPIDFSVKEVTA